MSTTVNEPPGRAKVAAAPRANAVLTLAIDVGGSRLKAGVLSETGAMVQGPARVDTPHPATPASVLALLENLISPLGRFDRISIGFPGMVRRGRVLTAPNLSDEAWHGYPLAAELARRTGRPARLLNDATVQGLGVINGRGLECVITLGTGMGFALFREGMLTPQLEIGQHLARNDMTYDEYVGNAAMADVGRTKWNKRVKRVIGALDVLVGFDEMHIGGGNAKHVAFELPKRCRIVSNEAGITGGVRLWDPVFDAVPDFAAEPLVGPTPLMAVGGSDAPPASTA